MKSLATSLLAAGALAFNPLATPAAPAGGGLSLTAFDSYGYTWSLTVDPATGAVQGFWDTTLVGCPVYDVQGWLSGGDFQLQVTQDSNPACDSVGRFFGTIDGASLTADGVYVGDSTGVFDIDWSFTIP